MTNLNYNNIQFFINPQGEIVSISQSTDPTDVKIFNHSQQTVGIRVNCTIEKAFELEKDLKPIPAEVPETIYTNSGRGLYINNCVDNLVLVNTNNDAFKLTVVMSTTPAEIQLYDIWGKEVIIIHKDKFHNILPNIIRSISFMPVEGMPKFKLAPANPLTTIETVQQKIEDYLEQGNLSLLNFAAMTKRMFMFKRGYKWFRENIILPHLKITNTSIITDEVIAQAALFALKDTLLKLSTSVKGFSNTYLFKLLQGIKISQDIEEQFETYRHLTKDIDLNELLGLLSLLAEMQKLTMDFRLKFQERKRGRDSVTAKVVTEQSQQVTSQFNQKGV